jgi:hypothetical protein
VRSIESFLTISGPWRTTLVLEGGTNTMNETVSEIRAEEDALGDVEVSANRLWGAQPNGLTLTSLLVSSVSAGAGR